MNGLVPGCLQADTILTAPSQIPGDCSSTATGTPSAHIDQDLLPSHYLVPGHLPISLRTTHLNQDLPMGSSPSAAHWDLDLPMSHHPAPGCLPMDSCLRLPPSDSTSVTTTVTSAGGALQVDSSLLMITDSPSTEAGSSLPTRGVTPIPSHLDNPIQPARPLAVPAALGTVIDQVITEHLETATAGLVKPTIRGIIDACIPHLTELMESHFTLLTAQALRKAAPCKEKNRKSYSKSYEGDYDGNYDEAAVVGRRKKPGPRGKMNCLHVSRDCRKSLILLIYVCRRPSMFTFSKRKSFHADPKTSFWLQPRLMLYTHSIKMVSHLHTWRTSP